MESDGISVAPLPRPRRCPYCGEINQSTMRMCWLCLEKLSIQEGAAPPRDVNDDGSRPPRSHGQLGDNEAFAVFGVLGVVIISVLAIEMPGLLFLLVALATPALLRAAVVVNQRAGESVRIHKVVRFLIAFVSALGVATIVGVVAFFAFAIGFSFACFANFFSRSKEYEIMLGASVGATLGLITAGLLFWGFWLRED
jgi:hypothetical protein